MSIEGKRAYPVGFESHSPSSSPPPSDLISTSLECAYCGLPVPGVSVDDPAVSGPQYCCYGCRLAAGIAGGHGPAAQSTLTLTRLGVAILLSMNVMVFSTLIYGQHVYASGEADASAVAAGTSMIFRYLSLFFTAPVLLLLGLPIALSAWDDLRAGRLSADLLIVLGVAAASVYSYVSVLRHRDGLYFDTACMTLVLVTLGKYLEATGKLKTTAAVGELEKLLPAEAMVIVHGEHRAVATELVQAGDVVYVRPGCRIPVDGEIIEGRSQVDEQMLTGESEPALKTPGGQAYAGTLCLDGALTIATAAAGKRSVFSGIIELLAEARRSKGRYQRLADRIAAVFVPGVVILALAAAVMALRHGVDRAILTGLAVVLISCPCALGLATPMALWVALGRAARQGVLFRDIIALESLSRVRTVCFDKTGTLTTGSAAVTEHRVESRWSGREAETLSLAAGLARTSTHHLSQALTRWTADQGLSATLVQDVQSLAGQGVVGVLQNGGVPAALGNVELMRRQRYAFSSETEVYLEELMARGLAVACLGLDGRVQAVFGFNEDLRGDAAQTVAALRRQGCEVRVLTGDHKRRGEAIAQRLSVPVEDSLLPADKIARLQALRAGGQSVAMVGDGVNDAPALAAADVGLAMGSGADISRESADVCLVRNQLLAVPWSIALSRRTVAVIRQNLFWAFLYNVAGVGLAMSGRLSPVFAAIAMVASSLLVLTNSLRLGRMPLGPVE